MLHKYLVEFLGSLFFIYVILATGSPIAIGAALAVAIIVGGPVSGGNFNPAVTIVMAAARKMPLTDVAPYIISQIAGGMVALQLSKMTV
jgi:glycerol uptake facilitator-like aquaporin